MLGCSFHTLSEIDSYYPPTLILQAPNYEHPLEIWHDIDGKSLSASLLWF